MGILRVAYAPTPPHLVEEMLDLADVRPGEVLYDLGCGDGRIAIAAAARGAQVQGFDLDPAWLRLAVILAARSGLPARFQEIDLHTVDLGAVDVVAFYLDAGAALKLIPQFSRMRPGSRIVSIDFKVGTVPPSESHAARDGFRPRNLHLYRNPLDWNL